MYSTQNEGKSVVTARINRILNKKIYKHMVAVSKNMYIDKIDGLVNNCNNTYHRKIKIKPADVKSGTYIGYGVEHNDKDPNSELVIM